MSTQLGKRQSSDGSDFGDNGYNEQNYDEKYEDDGKISWWWSPTGITVRYIIVAILFGFLLAYFIGGYYHAHRRLRRGLPPLFYHRWMVQRRHYAVQPQYQQYPLQHPTHYPPAGPQTEGYAPPPPAYNSDHAPPPAYQPPVRGNK